MYIEEIALCDKTAIVSFSNGENITAAVDNKFMISAIMRTGKWPNN
jgi:hypothetical protein